MRIPGAGIQHEERTVRSFDNIGEVGARLGEAKKFVFGGAVTGAFLLEFKTDDLLRVVERHHEVQVFRGSGERGDELISPRPQGTTAGNNVAKVGD